EEAVRVGMIYRTYSAESFAEDSWALARQLAQMPTRGLGLTKRALNKALHNDLEHQLEVEEQLQVNAGETADYREGVAAFLEKRKPVFTGE
ncbi:MAG: 2-(1,2-epoxy-1,2-dihydrophenyl)acetyl-CoA isomerase, partial [Bacteroidetes bacterium]